jgi:hypothetical protein
MKLPIVLACRVNRKKKIDAAVGAVVAHDRPTECLAGAWIILI